MAATTTRQGHREPDEELVREFEDFLQDYYKNEIGDLAGVYPKDEKSLWVDWQQVYRHNHALAQDIINHPRECIPAVEKALTRIDIPLDVKLDGAHVRFHNLNRDEIYRPPELRSEHGGQFVGIRGTLDRVTGASERAVMLEWMCERCRIVNEVPQPEEGDLQEPYQCRSCERQGPFNRIKDGGEFADYCKLRVKVPPNHAGGVDTDHIDGFVHDDLVDYGHDLGLPGRAGEDVVVYGILERREKQGAKGPIFDRVLDVHALSFESDDTSVDIDAHQETFEELAQREDAVDLWMDSLAPQLYATDALEAAKLFSIAYLFRAPRIDIPDSITKRGDLHGLLVGDFSTGKSTLAREVNLYSPDSVHKSATGLSSEVGLLAAATKDDFGAGQWTIKPGLLVKQDGGQLILEELDKTNADLAKMNDALEGNQVVDVEKAGESATYHSRVGLYATANPQEGRFDPYAAVAPQIGMPASLLSRFNAVITLQDQPDTERDELIAESMGKAYVEGQRVEAGEQDEYDVLDRPIPVEVGAAWIKHSWEECNPLLSEGQIQDISQWYASEVRQLNEAFANEEGEGKDMPVPANSRMMDTAMLASIAFARVRLRDHVHDEDVARAKDLCRDLVSNNWDGEKFNQDKTTGTTRKPRKSWTQDARRKRLVEIVRQLQPDSSSEGGVDRVKVIDRLSNEGADRGKVKGDLETMTTEGEFYEPANGEVRKS